jgi:hypothetical protein
MCTTPDCLNSSRVWCWVAHKTRLCCLIESVVFQVSNSHVCMHWCRKQIVRLYYTGQRGAFGGGVDLGSGVRRAQWRSQPGFR